jgi:N-acetylneuraminate synthase
MTTPNTHLTIGGRRVGPGEPCYVIAEAGLNHNGSLDAARALVDAAQAAGADAIKFQKRTLSEVYRQDILNDPRRGEQGLQYIVPLLAEFELPDEDFRELAAYCRRREMEFLCTPWDKSSVGLLEELGVRAYKIGSPDMTNFPLIEHVARTGKPVLISTGMSTEDEIRLSLAFLKDLRAECGVFHCVSTYPVAADEINLRFMARLREWCSYPIGYSGHEEGTAISIAAVGMGATMLERHITLDRTMRGPDHRASLEPPRFKELVDGVREVEAAVGVGHRWVSRGEVLNRRVLGKSLVAAVDLPAGATIVAGMVTAKSPGMGLSPQRIGQLLGRRLRRPVRRDDLFLEADLEEALETHESTRLDLGVPWGVVGRFTDLDPLIARFGPQGMAFIELHLSDRDLDAGVDAVPARRFPAGMVVHAPEYCHDTLLDLCADDDEQRAMSVRRIQQTIDLARLIAPHFEVRDARGPKVVVHVGGMSRSPGGYDRDAAAARLSAAIRALDAGGVDLLLENLPPCPWYFGGRWSGHVLVDAGHTRDLCEMTGLGLCFDTSHAALACHGTTGSLTGFVQAVKPYIRHLHIADAAGSSGEGLQIGDGQVDFLEIWPALMQTGATAVPEIWMGHHNVGSGFQTALNRLADIAWAARALAGVTRDGVRAALGQMVVRPEATLAAVLTALNANRLGTIFVVGPQAVVVGIATDGDIRRALLAGRTLQDRVGDVMTRDFAFAFADASVDDVHARLSPTYRVLPILDSARRLVSFATRGAPAVDGVLSLDR